MQRADRTLRSTEAVRGEENEIQNSGSRLHRDKVSSSLDRNESSEGDGSSTTTTSRSSFASDNDHDDDLLNYGNNPTITMTALAHTLWKSILRPGKDSAIDATAGNGGDAAVLAELLFPSAASPPMTTTTTSSHLVGVDIQEAACEATQARLSRMLLPDILHDHVSIHHRSHAPLPLPPVGSGPVAVVVYNLGYLPGQERADGTDDDDDDGPIRTATSTTLASLTDAILCLRLGGLLSVLTYPMTNAVEDLAVQAFVEGLALYSSQSDDWRDFLAPDDSDPRYVALGHESRREIRQRLHCIHEELGGRQCWRVHVHEKLGWQRAPRLLTATRVR